MMELFGISQKGKSANVTAQGRLNCYLEVQPGDDRSKVAIYGTPGLELLTTFGETPVRGIYQKGDLWYAVHRGTLWEVNNAGVQTVRGMIGTSAGKVYMADNGQQLMITDGSAGYIYYFNDITPVGIASITNSGTVATLTTTGPHNLLNGRVITVSGATPAPYNGTFPINVTGPTTFTYNMASNPGGNATIVGSYTVPRFTQITDPEYPGAKTVTWMDGYFIVPQPSGQRFYVSGINDGISWDALDFASAESNPDQIVSIIADNGNITIFGEISTEFWTNSGATDFPFTRVSGGATEWGCAAVNSIAKFDNTLAFLAKNRMGQVIIARLNGYLPLRISNPELEYIINNYSAVSDAVAFSYIIGGHPMYQISFPSGGDTWLYDGLSNCWSKLQGYGITRHRGELGINYIDRTIVTDYENGNVYTLSQMAYTDNGDPITMELVSRHIVNEDKRFIVDEIKLDMETGVGINNGQGSNPQIMLSVSKDGGHTWGVEQWAPFGKIGSYLPGQAIWRRPCGVARDVVFKFRVTDPVKRVILGSSLRIRGANT
jgi:hypothetical protein